jgi:hypothetical protein
MREDFVTQLRLQLRDAADREARRGPLRRLWQALRWDASRPAIAGMAIAAAVALLALVAIPYLRSDETLPAGRDLRLTADTQPFESGGWLLPAFGSVWASDPAAGEIVHLDRDSRATGRRIPVGGEAGLGAAAGYLWATAGGELLRIDPASGEITGRMSVGPQGFGVPVGAGDTVWLIDAMRLRHIDPERMVVDRTVRLDRGSFMSAGFAAGPDALYVQRADSRILVLDPGSGKRTGTIRLQRPGALASYTAGGLVLAAEDGVATVDPETGEQRWLRRLGVSRVNAIATDITTLWVQGSPASGGRDRLWRLDALDGRVLGSIDLPGFGVAGMAAVGDRAWVVTPGGQLQVVGPS